jgi:cell wall-associated NlpC family hydrolase
VTGRTATGGPVWGRTSGRSITGWAPIVVFLAALAVGLLVAAGTASADGTIASKQAQAQEVLAKVQQLYSDQERAAEAYNYAGVQLKQIDQQLELNGKNLVAAKKSLTHSRQAIATRVRELYVKGDGDSTLEVLLGSTSLEDVVNRLDAIQRVSSQDSRILSAVRRYKKEVLQRRSQLQDARAKQADLVQQRAEQKQAIEGQISEQNQLLSTIKDQIEQLKIEEQQRQAQLIAQARARAEAIRLAAERAQHQVAAQAAVNASHVEPAYNPNVPAPQYGNVVSIAMQYLGVPYVWGGASPSTGFDCSGFVMYVFAQIGVSLPHHAASQYNYGVPVSRDQLAPGDLVFFDGLGHVGIYIGNGQFIHAPHTGDVVKISSLYESWYSATYYGARRL